MIEFLATALIIVLTLALIQYVSERRSGGDGRERTLQLLPGDIKYESPSGNFRFYFPVATSIVLSIVLTLLMRLLS